MERIRFDRKIEIKENGKPMIKLSKKCNGTLGKMRHTKANVFLSEQKINPSASDQSRSFTLVIRNDGIDGEYKMGQLSFLKEEDLIQLRDSIDLMLKLNDITIQTNEKIQNVIHNHFYITK